MNCEQYSEDYMELTHNFTCLCEIGKHIYIYVRGFNFGLNLGSSRIYHAIQIIL